LTPALAIQLRKLKRPSVIPGFGLTLGFTLFYLAVIVVIPLSGLFVTASTLSMSEFWRTVTSDRVLHAYKISFGLSLLAAVLNSFFFGLIIAWILARYRFPFKKIIDAMVDLPFALPTAVAGIALTAPLRAVGLDRAVFRAAGHQNRFYAHGQY